MDVATKERSSVMKSIRSLRLIGLGLLAAAAIGFSVPSAKAQDSFSFGFSDRGGGFSVGVNDGRYGPYGYRDYGRRYYPRSYYDRPYYDRGYYRDGPRWRDRPHRVRVYDPYYDRYVWVWR
jgi:hypothetical protein